MAQALRPGARPPDVTHLRWLRLCRHGRRRRLHGPRRVGLDPEKRMYLLDVWRQQASSDVWVEAFCDLIQRWRPFEWAAESGQIKASVGPYLERRMRKA